MKFLTTLALFGLVSAQDLNVLDEDAELWVQVSGAHMRVVCPKLHPSLNDAIKNANAIPVSSYDEKAITELNNAQ